MNDSHPLPDDLPESSDPRITAYLFGELAEEERAAFERELEQSPTLRDEVEATRATIGWLEGALRSDGPGDAVGDGPRLSDEQRREVLRHAGEQPVAGRAAASGGVHPPQASHGWGWLVGAVSLAALAGVVWLVVQSQRDDRHVASAVGDVDSVGELADSTTSPLSEREAREAAARQFARGNIRTRADARAEDLIAKETELSVLIAERERNLTVNSSSPAGRGGMGRGMVPSSDFDPNAAMGGSGGGMPGMPGGVPAMGPSGSEGFDPNAASPGIGMAGMPASPATPYYTTRGPGDILLDNPPSIGRTDATRAAEGKHAVGEIDELLSEVTAGQIELGRIELERSRGDRHLPIFENPFVRATANDGLSTFSIDVDTASYAKVRSYLLEHGQWPPADAVRIEELVNYFRYDYAAPQGEHPFAVHLEMAECPWRPAHRLLRVALRGRDVERERRPTSNLVFLLDVSGSMDQPNKLPLLKRSMKLLVDQLTENDRVAIVVYAGAAGLVLPSTTGDNQAEILAALERLQAGGSTNGGEGITLAYQQALDHFIAGGTNRVILCTDGDFNVGVTGTDELVGLAEKNAKSGVYLSVLGFGMGNLNDSMLELVSNKGNGNYAFIDSDREARKVLVEQLEGTLVTIAKNVKIQVAFDPARVAAYRLIGYENRVMENRDFRDDSKDAGDIGAGHTVTALYEIVPVGAADAAQFAEPPVEESDSLDIDLSGDQGSGVRGQESEGKGQEGEASMLRVQLRYLPPDARVESDGAFDSQGKPLQATELVEPLRNEGRRFGQASRDFRFAASVAAFGMALRHSAHRGDLTLDGVLEIAQEAAGPEPDSYRREYLELIQAALRTEAR